VVHNRAFWHRDLPTWGMPCAFKPKRFIDRGSTVLPARTSDFPIFQSGRRATHNHLF
jgi:hypothetical protein